jgi:tRNA threonylcarbamoyl adenosine modification protein (Sua5/YciO/YrdC/YwlC family)
MNMLIKINPLNPEPRLINRIVHILKNDGVIAYPTDTVYGFGCSIFSKKGMDRIRQMKRLDPRKPISIVCHDLSDISRYAIVSNYAYRILKRLLPGPYTFILPATREVPRLMLNKQKQVGVRIPDSPISLAIVKELGHPIVTSSATIPGRDLFVDPEEIENVLGHALDAVIDGGFVGAEHSSIVELGEDSALILRDGKGDVSFFR